VVKAAAPRTAPVALHLATVLLQIGLVGGVLALLPGGSWLDLDRFEYPKELVLNACALAAAACALVAVQRAAIYKRDLPLLGFIALGLLSTLGAPNRWLAWRALAVSISSFAVYQVARLSASRGHATRLFAVAAGSAALVALMVCLESYGVIRPIALRAPGGTLATRNQAGHFLVLALPLVCFLVARVRGRVWFALGVAGIVILAAAIVLTRSRAAWLAALGWIGIGWPLLRWRRPQLCDGFARARIAWMVVAALGGVLLVAVLPPQLQWSSRTPYADTLARLIDYQHGSGHGRLLQYRATLAMAAAHPILGTGPGNWALAYPTYASPHDPTYQPPALWQTPAHASSDWLGFAAERGWFALGLLVAFLVLRAPCHFLAYSTLFVLAIMGAFDALLQLALPAYTVFAMLGACAPAGERPLLRLGVRPTRGLVALTAAFAIATTAFLGNEIRAFRGVDRARTPEELDLAGRASLGHARTRAQVARLLYENQRCDLAIEQARSALALDRGLVMAKTIHEKCMGSQ
jgi:O-antigen ligase